MTKAKAIAKNNPVDTATMEKFLAAKTHVGYRYTNSGAKIWYELDLAQIGDTKISKATAAELLKNGFDLTIDEYLAAQEENLQRSVAEKLLQKVAESQLRLKNQVAELKLLLQHGKDYVEFSLNILARISASETYGATAQRDSQRTRRMFEANV